MLDGDLEGIKRACEPTAQRPEGPNGSQGQGDSVAAQVGRIQEIARALEGVVGDLRECAGSCQGCDHLEHEVNKLRRFLAVSMLDGLCDAERKAILADPGFAAVFAEAKAVRDGMIREERENGGDDALPF